MMEKAKRKKKALAEALRRDILTMRLAPHSDLNEISLSVRFGLSRTPLREVLHQLAGEGYLEIRENRGARVSEMSYETLRDFFLVAPMIYGSISRLAVQGARPIQIRQLKDAQHRFQNASRKGSVEERTLANKRFHEIMGEMAENRYLMQTLRRLLIDHARIGMTFYRPRNPFMIDNLAKASEQHDGFIECIERGDEDGAAELAVAHWQLSRGMLEMFVMPRELNIPLDVGASPEPAEKVGLGEIRAL